MTKKLTKVLMAFISILFVASIAFADTCESQAAAKKLVGAAKNSFIKKCKSDIADTQKYCEARAKELKVLSSAKNIFMQKCMKANTNK